MNNEPLKSKKNLKKIKIMCIWEISFLLKTLQSKKNIDSSGTQESHHTRGDLSHGSFIVYWGLVWWSSRAKTHSVSNHIFPRLNLILKSIHLLFFFLLRQYYFTYQWIYRENIKWMDFDHKRIVIYIETKWKNFFLFRGNEILYKNFQVFISIFF